MPIKIIAGGQDGADLAGLEAAYQLKLRIGGTMPMGFRTLSGPKPAYAKRYGVKEHHSPDYPPRTFQNVKDSDATFRFYTKPNSPGELLTLRALTHYNKPFLDFDLRKSGYERQSTKAATKWLIEHNIKVLNIAGNSEQTSKGIYQFTYTLLMEILRPL